MSYLNDKFGWGPVNPGKWLCQRLVLLMKKNLYSQLVRAAATACTCRWLLQCKRIPVCAVCTGS
jgi:hypothetical protein